MAASIILRRAASRLAPLSFHAIETRSNYYSTLSTLLKNSFSQKFCQMTLPFSHHFSSLSKKSSSDDNLVRVVESEIKCAEESDEHDRIDEIPNGFPFEIQDNPSEQTITLRREYQGEKIKVVVYMPDLVTGDGVDDDDADADGNDEKANQSSIPLVVTVSKETGPSLEFGCTAYPDEVSVDSMSVKEPEASEDQIAYEGPDFSDLDENLQKAFHKYLEIRGIKASTTNFLHEYMVNKDSREYLMWLKNLKKFIEK